MGSRDGAWVAEIHVFSGWRIGYNRYEDPLQKTYIIRNVSLLDY